MMKEEFYIKYVVALLALLAPINPMMWTLIFLIVSDFITGVYAARKAKIAIQSSKIARTVSKFFFYNLAILCGYFTETFIIPEIPFFRVISGFIATTELKSIFENFNKIYGINIWVKIKTLFDKKYE